MGEPVNRNEEWLADRMAEWIDDGLLTPFVAEKILEHEAARRSPGAAGGADADVEIVDIDAAPERVEITTTTEVAVYIGVVLVLVGMAVALAGSWDPLRFVGRMLLAVLVGAVGLVGGFTLHRSSGAAQKRLAGFLWLVATAAAALMATIVVDQADSLSDAARAMVIGAAVGGTGGALWRNHARPPQMMSCVVGLIVFAGGLLTVLEVSPKLSAPTTIAIGLAAMVLGAGGHLRPETEVMAVGAGIAFLGVGNVGRFTTNVNSILGVIVAVAVIGLGAAMKRVPVVVIGAGAMLVSSWFVVRERFDGLVASLVMTLVGIVIVVVVLVRLNRRH